MRCLIVLAITSLVACADRSAHMNSERLDSAVPVWSVEDEVAFYDARDVTSGASGFVDPLGFAEDSHAYRLSSAIITAESRYCRSWIVTQKVNAGDGEITAHWICEGSSGQVRAGILEVLDDAYCVRSIVSDLKDDLFSIYSMNMGQSDVLDDSRFDVLDASTAYVTLMHEGKIIRGAIHDPSEKFSDIHSQEESPPDRVILDVEHEISARIAPCLLVE